VHGIEGVIGGFYTHPSSLKLSKVLATV
jgi:hypothetical protein